MGKVKNLIEEMFSRPLKKQVDGRGTINLVHGDCNDELLKLPSNIFDLILVDVPYPSTAQNWEELNWVVLWRKLRRIMTKKCISIFIATPPYSSKIIVENLEMYKYTWYWKKTKPNGWQHAKNKPMTIIEECCVFSGAKIGHKNLISDSERMTYHPLGIEDAGIKTVSEVWHGQMMGKRANQVGKEYEAQTNFPSNFIEFPNVTGTKAIHPTEKPVDLGRYLIKMYSKPGQNFLDFTCGSGSFVKAAYLEGLNVWGIDNGYCEKDININSIPLKGKKWIEITKLRLEGYLE